MPPAKTKSSKRAHAGKGGKTAGRTKKGRFVVRFELGIGGIAALVIVCACIFLWMFLFGVWAGQTVLQGKGPLAAGKGDAGGGPVARRGFAPLERLADLVRSGTAENEAEPEYAGATFFSLQVDAAADEKAALASVAAWRARGYDDVFYTAPSGKETRFRVFVGRYDTLDRANEMAAGFAARNNATPYITLLDETEVREP